ncbi:hypothetical protein GOV13_00140 [Candidatus Pacearchaeota archaeon]|nr:hypothetical protein [Candidatus Pacearchaeota archaeon]
MTPEEAKRREEKGLGEIITFPPHAGGDDVFLNTEKGLRYDLITDVPDSPYYMNPNHI